MGDYTINTKVLGTGVKTRQLIFNPVAGYTRTQFDLLVRRVGFTDDGDYSDERSATTFSGYTGSNTTTTDDGQVLYIAITGTTDAVVTAYSDSAKTQSVATGTDSNRSGGALALAEANSSGLSGSITLAASCTNDDYTVLIEDYHDRYDQDVDASASNIIGIDNGLATDFTATTDRDIMNLVYECDSAKLDELGMDNVADHLERQTVIDNCKLKNITLI